MDLWYLPKLNSPEYQGIKRISTKGLSGSITNPRDLKRRFNPKVLPLSMNEGLYGIKKKFHTSVVFSVRYNKFDITDYKIFDKRVYEDLERSVKTVVHDLDERGLRKRLLVYDLSSESLICSYIDEKISEAVFRRSSGNYSCLIPITSGVEATQIRTEQWNLLSPIKKIRRSRKDLVKNTYNKNIGSFDLETYRDYRDDTNKVYAIGYAINAPEKVEYETFYIDRDLDSNALVLNCFIKML